MTHSAADPEDDQGLPSNHELGERMARLEEQQEHMTETLDRIDESLDEEIAELRENQQEKIKPKVRTLWTGYRLARWAGGSAGLLTLAIGTIYL